MPSLLSFARVFLLLLCVAATIPAFAHEQIITDVESALGDGSADPPLTGWQPTRLPDRWDLTRPNYEGVVWYRFRLPAPPTPVEPWAMLIERASMNVEVYVNGLYIGSGGRITDPVTRAWNRPQYYLLPLRAIERGRLDVLMRVYGYRNSHAGISPVDFGTDGALRPIVERTTTTKVWGPLLVSALAVVMGVYALFYWRMIPGQAIFGWFGVTALVWAARNLDFFVRDVPMSAEMWNWLVNFAGGAYFALLTMFTLRFFGDRSRRQGWLLVLFALVGPVAALLVAGERSIDVLRNGSLITAPLAFAVTLVLLGRALRTRDIERLVVAIVYGLHAAAMTYDLAIDVGIRPFESTYGAHYISLLLFGVILWLMIRRYAASLGQVEDLNRNLESRITLREKQLAESYSKLRSVEVSTERESAMLNERQRIMRDMHDGVGSQLVAALDSVRRGKLSLFDIEESLKDILDDLRLVIDSLEPGHGDLLALLGNFRYRMERRLRASGIELTWRVGEVPDSVSLDSSRALQLLRIVQEAFSNIIKHANATRIRVDIKYRESTGSVELTVSDNGRGFNPDTVRRGRGLDNIEARVAAIGAVVRLSSDHAGTRFAIVFRAEALLSVPAIALQR